jgi:pre-rRNA-processing protein TSR1
VTLHIKGVKKLSWEKYKLAGNNENMIIYGLLQHEQQMSVLNVVVKRTGNSTIPIKSKERLLIQCGYRRFIVNPIFSQHTNGDKHKVGTHLLMISLRVW